MQTENKKNYNVVLYTDGSFVNNNSELMVGFRGSGVHGYFYELQDIKKSTTNRPNKFVITNKGYWEENNFKETDEHFLVTPSYYLDASFSFVNHGTANTAELEAVLEILKYIQDLEEMNIQDITLRIDSIYTIQWINKFIENQDVNYDDNTPNVEVVKELEQVVKDLIKNGHKLIVIKVAGHTGEVGNETADTLAKHARIQSCVRNIFKTIKLYPASKYWSKDESRHPLLRYKQLFFTNTLKAPNDQIIYSVMDYATDVEPGRKTHNACFGLVALKEYQKLIEDAIRVYHEQSYRLSRRSVVSTLNLNNLFNRNTTHYFDMFLDKIFNFDKRGFNLNNLHDDPIVYTISPGGLALQALDRMGVLYSIMSEFKDKENKPSIRKFIDITEKIYKRDKNKKGEEILTTLIPNGTNTLQFKLEIDNNELPITFDLGKDTLSRNQFKQIEKTVKGVWLVLQPISKEVYYYYTVVDLGEEGLGVFCNFYSGKIFVTDKMKKNK